MKPIRTNYEKDIFPKRKCEEVVFEDRITGKGIVFNDEQKIALVGTTVNFIYTLPGGGVEDGEKVEDGIIREVKEETGYDVEIIKMIGVIDDYRNRDKKHCICHCAVAKISGERQDQILTNSEKENGLHVKWFSTGDALELLENEYKKVLNGEISYYNTAFNIARDLEFLKEFLSNK